MSDQTPLHDSTPPPRSEIELFLGAADYIDEKALAGDERCAQSSANLKEHNTALEGRSSDMDKSYKDSAIDESNMALLGS